MKRRTGEPWIPGNEYGRLLPSFTVNLLVRDVERSVSFYRVVLGATVHYADPDFAAIKLLGTEFMLHADHTYEAHPWLTPLADGAPRGLGAELRLLGLDPTLVERRARDAGATVVRGATVRGHGWTEVMVADPDGYVWAVGELTPRESGQAAD